MQHYLEVPFFKVDALKDRHKITPIKGGLAIYAGATIPRELRPYLVQDFSLGRWMEDERNALVLPPSKSSPRTPLKQHQQDAISAIVQGRKTGYRGYLLMDPPTLNPRLTILSTVVKMARDEGFGEKKRAKVLILGDPLFQENWRQLLYSLPGSQVYLRCLLMEYRSMDKLISAPPQARISPKKSLKVKMTAEKGVGSMEWDYIIVDDSHTLNGADVRKVSIIASLEDTSGSTPFVIFSAPGFTLGPDQMSLYAPILAPSMRGKNSEGGVGVTPSSWGSFLRERGITLVKSKTGALLWLPQNEERAHLEQRYLNRPLRDKNIAMGRKATSIARRDTQRQELLYVPSRGDTQLRYLSTWGEVSQELLRRTLTPEEALALYQTRMGYLKMSTIVKMSEEHNSKGNILLIKVPSKSMGESISQELLKKRISSVLHHRGMGNLSPILHGSCRVIIATGDLLSLDTSPLGKYTSPTVLCLDYLTPGHPNRVSILEKKLNDPYILLPAFSDTVEERMARHAMEALTAADKAELPGRLERSLKAAAARTPAPGHLS